jgi:hypothetical protein
MVAKQMTETRNTMSFDPSHLPAAVLYLPSCCSSFSF